MSRSWARGCFLFLLGTFLACGETRGDAPTDLGPDAVEDLASETADLAEETDTQILDLPGDDAGTDVGVGESAETFVDAEPALDTPDPGPEEVAAELSPELSPEIDAPEPAPEIAQEIEIEEEVAPPPLVELPLTTLADGFHVPLVPPEAGAPFSLIVASDPQLWWNSIDDLSGDEVSDEAVEAQNQLHIDAMNVLIAGEQLPEGAPAPMAAVMNGDLTEYGRWKQWDAYYRLYEGVNAPIFDGLGNHDYENNNVIVSNGCAMDVLEWQLWRDACEGGSTQTLWGQSACEVKDSLTELWVWCAKDTMRRMRYWLSAHAEALFDSDEGSAAYSFELGDVHFVQLHNDVNYEVPETGICSSLNWLKKDLKAAFLADRKIVLLMHRPISNSLKAELEGYQYNIVGIFYGHIHAKAGYTGDYEVGEVSIPKFYSGSVQWNVFSLASFGAEQLTVTVIDSNTGAPVHHATEEAYDNLNGASAAAPFTYVYPVHDCPSGQIPTGPDGACETPSLETPPVELCY